MHVAFSHYLETTVRGDGRRGAVGYVNATSQRLHRLLFVFELGRLYVSRLAAGALACYLGHTSSMCSFRQDAQ
jgi:hypothetical protein